VGSRGSVVYTKWINIECFAVRQGTAHNSGIEFVGVFYPIQIVKDLRGYSMSYPKESSLAIGYAQIWSTPQSPLAVLRPKLTEQICAFCSHPSMTASDIRGKL
jgi:hypothetical protein